jgi:hypothetical protein
MKQLRDITPKWVALLFASSLLALAAYQLLYSRPSHLVFEGTASLSGYAALYADHGKGIYQVTSRNNEMWMENHAVRVIFPINPKGLQTLRFDPIPATNDQGFRLLLTRISWELNRFQNPFEVDPRAIQSLSGVLINDTQEGLEIIVPPNLKDPRMILPIPVLLQSGSHPKLERPVGWVVAGAVLLLRLALALASMNPTTSKQTDV